MEALRRAWNRPLPPPRRIGWWTVILSVMAYFIFDRAVANAIAIVGAVVLTISIYRRDGLPSRR